MSLPPFNPNRPQPKSDPGEGDDVACVKCGAVALDTGLECSECGHDNYEAVTGKPFGVAPSADTATAEQARIALDNMDDYASMGGIVPSGAFQVLRKFIEQVEPIARAAVPAVQEPVAWMQIGVGPMHEGERFPRLTRPKEWNPEWWRFEPLYAAPQSGEAATERDAARYRWLRSIGSEQLRVMAHYAGGALDEQIDAALSSIPAQGDADPLTKLTRLSEEMGLYDEGAQEFDPGLGEPNKVHDDAKLPADGVPVSAAAEWLLYEHDDGRHAVAPAAEAATFAHGDPAWHRVGPVAVYGVGGRDAG